MTLPYPAESQLCQNKLTGSRCRKVATRVMLIWSGAIHTDTKQFCNECYDVFASHIEKWGYEAKEE